MLPSMPILFSKESQDAFGNKIEPSTSFFSQNSAHKSVTNSEPPPEKPQEAPTVTKEVKTKKEPEKKKKNDPPNTDDNALENAFIKSYYSRVKQRFSYNPHVPTNKFTQFQNILRDFDPNKENPIDLYKKVEQLFGAEHKDMVEDFLLFLKPGQAAEVGRFMDRFSLVRMTGFIDLLHKTFARKPTVLRKVLRALTAGLNSGNSAEAKSRVTPHFRAHPRLSQMFLSLFPDERPPESMYETGTDTINESFLTSDRGCDVWEFADDDTSAKRKLDANECLDTTYLNGRVFLQHGRLLRSARVTFPYSKEPYRVHARRLAPAHCHLSPPDSDDETQKKKQPQKRPRKQTKSPTKKDLNDNTRKDKDPIMSPKPKKAQKPKNVKKEEAKQESGQKRERKDSKTTFKKEIENPQKKDQIESPKVKQPKIWIVSENPKVKDVIETPKLKQAKIEPIVIEKKIEPRKEQITTPKVKQAKIEATVSVETKKIEKMNNWTRDEDKTMLQVLKGEAGSEKVFGRIRELLPHRTETEIKDRFCHVMTLLQQMAVGEVT